MVILFSWFILFQEFNVLDTMPAEAIPLKAEAEQLVWVWLVSSTVLLGLLLLLVLSICLSQRASYQRQLKAATATAFGWFPYLSLCSQHTGKSSVSTFCNY